MVLGLSSACKMGTAVARTRFISCLSKGARTIGSTSSPITFTPVTPALGAIVTGIQPFALNPETAKVVTDAVLKHRILFFRDPANVPDITEAGSEAHRASAALLGKLHVHPVYPHVHNVPEIIVLDTHERNLPDNDNWHTDVTFIKTPPAMAMLLAVQLPPTGGDTMWACNTAAYQSLSDRMKHMLNGLVAEHDFVKSFPEERWGVENPEGWQTAKKRNPPVLHPVVRTHPITKEKGIFVNDGFTTRIMGLPKSESDMLLAYLFRHIARPEHTVRWRWQPGDVALWDNRNTQHYALADYIPHRRIMRRATVLGDEPYYLE